MSWQEHLAQSADRAVVDLVDFCRIPSVSTDPDHTDDCRRGAEWVVGRLRAAGIESTEVIESPGHPVAYGEWLAAPGAPTARPPG